MDLMTADDILGADDTEYREIPIPGKDKSVRVRSLKACQATEMSAALAKYPEAGAMIIWAVMCAVDMEGNLLFKEDNIPQLMGKDLKLISAIGKGAAALNGVTDEEIDEAKKQSAETGESDSVSS